MRRGEAAGCESEAAFVNPNSPTGEFTFHIEWAKGSAIAGFIVDKAGNRARQVWEHVRGVFKKAKRILFMGKDAVACDKPSLAYLLEGSTADILYCFDDGAGNALYEHHHAPNLVKQLRGQAPRKGRLLNHMELGEARCILVEIACAIYGNLRRYDHIRKESLTLRPADGHD